ncbi:MAG: type ISP restriction/modification enzyme, partial [Cyclobacteriaceae bacterium]
ELLDNANMEAVIRDFGDRNPQEDPVIHFYELFLKEYDAKKRMQRGVFYTPRPVVSYIVRSVDELLRTEFGLEDGLADTTTWGEMVKRHKGLKIPDGVSPDQEFVQILDPASGTGTFLVEVIDVIHKTLITKWGRENYGPNEIERLWNDYVSNHLLTRLHGYELMMAPYAIAHLKVGLKLHETEYRFQSEERARIYLTNALEPAQDFSGQFEFAAPALAAEANSVNEVKRRVIFTVLLGNPPYSGESANSSAWVYDLLRGKVGQKTGDFNSYFHVANRPLGEHNSKWLNDDYVKFVRFVHWATERAGVGAVCMITNHGYLDNPTFRGMRYSLGGTFQKVFVLDLHGNSKKKEKTPTGGKDDNVFEIQQGVAIGVFLRAPWFSRPGDFRHAELWGERDSKYKLLEAGSALRMEWTAFEPSSPHYLFTPQSTELRGEYDAWWQVSDIFPINSTGIATARDDLTVHWSDTEVWEVVRDFAHMNSEEARLKYDLGPDARDWQIKLAQADLIDSGLTNKKVLPVMYKPFDFRYTYFTGKSRGFHCMPRGEVMNHVISDPENRCLVFSRSVSVSQSFHHVFCTNRLMLVRAFTDAACVAYVAPLFTQSVPEDLGLLFEAETSSSRWNGKNVNFADQFLADLGARLGLNSIRRWMSELSPNDIFDYIYAILHSPIYSQRYEKFLKVEFPRIPLTSSMLLFKSLTEIGGKLSSLHLLKSVELDPSMVEYLGGSSAIVEKVLWDGKSVWLDKAQTTGFKGVSEDVWNFHIGGYQV